MQGPQQLVRTIVLVGAAGTAVVVALGCGAANSPDGSQATPAKAPPAPAERAAVAKPHVNPHQTARAKAVAEPVVMSQDGIVDLVVGSETMHFSVLPPGQNMARATAGRKALLSVAGATKTGYPHILVEMTGWRPDQLRYPIELKSTKMQNFRFVYRASDRGALATKLDATLRGENTVTLESYEDGVLAGRFSGTVAPRDPAQGPPIAVKGTFKTTLRLHNVEPNPTGA